MFNLIINCFVRTPGMAPPLPVAPPVPIAQRSLAQVTVYHMRLEGTLHKLTGDGCLDEQDLEAEWQHKLDTSLSWQEKTDHMDNHQRETFFRIERHLFIERIHDAFARAQAKLEWQAKLESQEKPKPDHLEDVEVALVKFQYDRLRELDGFPRESPQELPQELPRVPETFVQQALTPKEYEALALAMLQQNRLHRDSPEAVQATYIQNLPKEKHEALALAMVEDERKQWQTKKRLVRKESRKRKSEEKRSERQAIEAAGEKSDAEQKRTKIEKSREARKALKARRRAQRAHEEEVYGRNLEARMIEEQARETRLSQAKATLLLQEEQKREAREAEEQAKAEEQRLGSRRRPRSRRKLRSRRKQRSCCWKSWRSNAERPRRSASELSLTGKTSATRGFSASATSRPKRPALGHRRSC